MLHKMERVHIASFVVGITGLIIGIVGIVLAIVFGTATTTCPAVSTQVCHSKLFSFQTSLTNNSLPWNSEYGIPNSAEFNKTSKEWAQKLAISVQTGLNTPSSRTLFGGRFKSMAVLTGSDSNQVLMQITEFKQDANGLTVAVGSGVVSAARTDIPDQNSVDEQIQNADSTVADTVTTSPAVCKPVPEDCCSCCFSTVAQTTATPTTQGVISTISQRSTATPTASTTRNPIAPTTGTPSTTVTNRPSTSTNVPSTRATSTTTVLPSTGAPSTTSPSSTVPSTVTPSTSAPTTGAQSTASPSSAIPSTATPSTSAPTTGVPSTTSSSSAIPSTVTPSTSAPSTAGPSTSFPSTTVPTTTGASSTVSSSTVVSSTSASSTIASTTVGSTTGSTSTLIPTTTTTPTTIVPTTSLPTSTVVPSTTTTFITTTSPHECYYQSNVAVAYQLTKSSSSLDDRIQNFISSKLFANQDVYRLGSSNTNTTQLALVPYPIHSNLPYSNYGMASSTQEISVVLNGLYDLSLGGDADISQAFSIIPTLEHRGYQGFVILVGASDEFVAKSQNSAQTLKNLGYAVYTVSFNATANFTSLQSQLGYGATVNSDSDEDTVAENLASLLYDAYCLPHSTTVGSTTSASTVVPSTGAPSTVAATTIVSSTVASSTVPSSTVNPSTAASPTIVSSTLASTSALPTTVVSSSVVPTTLVSSSISPSSTVVSSTVSSSTLISTSAVPSTVASSTAAPSTLVSSSISPSTVASSTASSSTLISTSTVPSTVQSSSVAPTTLASSSISPSTVVTSTLSSSTLTSTSVAPSTVPSSTVNPSTLASTSALPTTVQSSSIAPSTSVSSSISPSTAVSSTASSSTLTSTSAVPSTVVSSTDSPSTTAQSSTISSTVAPSTSAPTTIVPSTSAPSTNVPSTTSSSTSTTSFAQSTPGQTSTVKPSTYTPTTTVSYTPTTSECVCECTSSVPITTTQPTTVSSTVAQSTITTTSKPPAPTNPPTTSDPCQCAGDWVYSGDLAIAYESIPSFNSNSIPSQNYTTTINFLNLTLFGTPVIHNYALKTLTKAKLVPYPNNNKFPYYSYGSITSQESINGYIDLYQGLSNKTYANISEALTLIRFNQSASSVPVIILIGSDTSDVANALPIANELKSANYTIITVSSGGNSDLSKLASSPNVSFTIDNQDDNSAVAASIADFLVNLSPGCNTGDDEATAAPTRCSPTTSISSTPPASTTVAPVATTSSSQPSSASPTVAGSSIATSAATTSQAATTPSSSTNAAASTQPASTVTSLQTTNTIPVQACTDAFQGDIAVAFENIETSANVADFLSNYLFNNQVVYSFSNVTRVSNVPYPNPTQYSIARWGSIKSLESYQANIEGMSDSVYSSPTISDALNYIRDSLTTNVVNKIVIIAGTADSGVDAAVASMNQLRAQGYKVISISVDNSASRFHVLADHPYNVNDGNRVDVSQQIANLICQIGTSQTTVVYGSSTIGLTTVASSSSTITP